MFFVTKQYRQGDLVRRQPRVDGDEHFANQALAAMLRMHTDLRDPADSQITDRGCNAFVVHSDVGNQLRGRAADDPPPAWLFMEVPAVTENDIARFRKTEGKQLPQLPIQLGIDGLVFDPLNHGHEAYLRVRTNFAVRSTAFSMSAIAEAKLART